MDADVPVKAVKIPTAPTAGVNQEMKDLQTEEIFDGRYAVDVYKLRSIKPSPQAMMAVNAARKKVLQITTFLAMRAIRAVLYKVLSASRTPLSSPQFSRID